MAILLAGCADVAESEQNTASVDFPNLSEAGQTSCVAAGGMPVVARQLDGTREGVCALPNGKRCGDQALTAGNCG